MFGPVAGWRPPGTDLITGKESDSAGMFGPAAGWRPPGTDITTGKESGSAGMSDPAAAVGHQVRIAQKEKSLAHLECLAQQPAGDHQRPTVTNIDSNA